MSYARLALLSTAISLCLGATPAFAQTFNGFDNKDPAVTQGYAPYEAAAGGITTAGIMVRRSSAPWWVDVRRPVRDRRMGEPG